MTRPDGERSDFFAVVLPSHKTPADYIEGILELVDDVETTSGSVRQGASSSSASAETSADGVNLAIVGLIVVMMIQFLLGLIG